MGIEEIRQWSWELYDIVPLSGVTFHTAPEAVSSVKVKDYNELESLIMT